MLSELDIKVFLLCIEAMKTSFKEDLDSSFVDGCYLNDAYEGIHVSMI